VADLIALSNAAERALEDADRAGAKVASAFLRGPIHELFREARLRGTRCDGCELHPHALDDAGVRESVR
jgi:hypothetical protein